MTESLLLIFVVVTAYLAAHVVFERLARRFRLVSGAEYLVLGVLLGSQVTGLLPSHVIGSFNPLITLGMGWIGALAGTQLSLARLVRIPAVRYRVALSEALLTGLFVGGLEYVALRWIGGVADPGAGLIAAALGLLSLPSSPEGVHVVARAGEGRDPLVRQLEVTTAMHGVIASAGLAVLFALRHDSPTTLSRQLVPTEWVAITLAIGVVGGTLFHIFVGEERKVDRLFISLAGALILVSGAAAALQLSPVFAGLVFGIILGNTRGNRAELIAALSRVERPFYFALLIFAGASWTLPETSWALPLVVFLLLRPLSRIASARLGARMNGMLPVLGRQWGRGLLGQGGFAIVLAFDYVRQGQMPAASLVFGAAVASVLLTDSVSARLIQSVQQLPGRLASGLQGASPVREEARP